MKSNKYATDLCWHTTDSNDRSRPVVLRELTTGLGWAWCRLWNLVVLEVSTRWLSLFHFLYFSGSIIWQQSIHHHLCWLDIVICHRFFPGDFHCTHLWHLRGQSFVCEHAAQRHASSHAVRIFLERVGGYFYDSAKLSEQRIEFLMKGTAFLKHVCPNGSRYWKINSLRTWLMLPWLNIISLNLNVCLLTEILFIFPTGSLTPTLLGEYSTDFLLISHP